MIPRVRPSYTLDELQQALRAPVGTPGAFEHELASYFGMKHALVFPYGRSAIFATFRALGLGGEIVQPAYNCVVVAHATICSGNQPVFVDCLADDPNQDAEAMLRNVNTKTAAVVPTSIFGKTFDAAALVKEIRKRNRRAFVLVDCAQCFNAEWDGNLLAAEGDGAVLAFGIGKAMTTLFGGALLTNRDDLAEAVSNFRDRSRQPPIRADRLQKLAYLAASWVALTGWGVNLSDGLERSGALEAKYLLSLRSRESIRLPRDNGAPLSDLQAAIGRVQLTRLPGFLQRRKEISAIYAQAMRGQCGVTLPEWGEGSTHTIYTLHLDEAQQRRHVLDQLRRRGVQGGRVLDYVVPELPCYRELRGFGDFPNAHAWSERALNLPNHPSLTNEQVMSCASALIDSMQHIGKGSRHN